MAAQLDDGIVAGWERAWRQAGSLEKIAFLHQVASERGQVQEALCGLLRSTYSESDLAARNDVVEAEKPSSELTEAVEPKGEWWEE